MPIAGDVSMGKLPFRQSKGCCIPEDCQGKRLARDKRKGGVGGLGPITSQVQKK